MHLHVYLQRRLVELGIIDVHHYLVGIGGPSLVVVADLTDIKSAAQRENEVASLHYEVAASRSDRTRTACVVRVVVRYEIVCIPRCDNGDLKHIRSLKKKVLHACEPDSLADNHDGALRLFYLLQDLSGKRFIVGGVLLNPERHFLLASLEMP